MTAEQTPVEPPKDTPFALTGEMFIGSDRVLGTGGELRAVNPRSGAELPTRFGVGGTQDAARAATLAGEAFASYRATSPGVRAAFLDRIADHIERIETPLRACVVAETGIPQERVRGELGRTTSQLRLFAEVVRDGAWLGTRFTPPLPDRRPLPRPDVRLHMVPVGPVAVFSASNFPLAFSVAGGDTASALAAGCPVVVKAHGSHPGTSELVAGAVRSAVADAGLHPGVFSLLHGPGETIGISLVTHEDIQAVGFTGSRRAGLALMAAVSRRVAPIPFYGEMSSVNPVFLLPHALEEHPDQLADGFFRSCTTGAGQLCTSPGLVFAVEGTGLATFTEKVSGLMASSSAQPMLNASISSSYASGIRRLQDHPGVEQLAIGATDEDIASAGAPAFFATDAATFFADPSLQEEIFGATSLLVRLDDVDQIRRAMDVVEPQLTVSIHLETEDTAVAQGLLEEAELKAGRIVFNDWPTGVEVCAAMVHGGPFPATTDGRSTSVGTLAIERFVRPVAYQNCPTTLLPEELVL
jgi:alpha-ketoglutaric semialdehyde dehydrogenase